MNYSETFEPKWASIPGDTINDVLNEEGISIASFAQRMDSDLSSVHKLLFGYTAINDDVANKLEKVLGIPKDFWITREEQYRKSVERLKHESEQKWIAELPIKEMISFKWLPNSNNLINACLNFFDVPNVWTWQKVYQDVFSFTSFRKSEKIKSLPASTAVWLRQGEIQSESIVCKAWNQELLKELLPTIRKLTFKKDPKVFIPQLKELLSSCGIALVVVRTPNGCAASGATKFITKDKAMIILSFRHFSDDHFWFTLFHEIGHLILHDHRCTFVDEENEEEKKVNKEELEANKFAETLLIPEQFQNRLGTMRIDKTSIINLARDADISLGIVVGQLQHSKRIKMNHFNGFKRRYLIEDISTLSH